jgi:hypothetical protein
MKREENYTVWVGGTEVIGAYVSKEVAEQTAKWYRNQGYTDVFIDKVR